MGVLQDNNVPAFQSGSILLDSGEVVVPDVYLSPKSFIAVTRLTGDSAGKLRVDRQLETALAPFRGGYGKSFRIVSSDFEDIGLVAWTIVTMNGMSESYPGRLIDSVEDMQGVALDLNPQLYAPGVLASLFDTSGNDRDFTCVGTPTCEAAGGPNGSADVRFDSGDYGTLAGDAFGALTEGDIFVIWKFDNASTADGTTNAPWKLGDNGSQNYWKLTAGPSAYEGAGSTARKTLGNPTQLLTDWHMVRVTTTADEYSVACGAQALFTTAVNVVGFAPTCLVGATTAGAEYLVGNIARLVVFDHKLSADELAIFKSLMIATYGAVPGT